MANKILILECITNMHVGNGDVNYNIIDNEVEKDPVTGYPTINSSGVKGAFREYFKKDGKVPVDDWFGSEGTKRPGNIKFLAAEFVSLPVRASEGEKAAYYVTTKCTVERVNRLAQDFISRDLITNIEGNNGKEKAEGFSLTQKAIFGNSDIYILNDNEMRAINLPVMARNKLENGESKNLWYEEIVPHGSKFIVPILCDNEEMLNSFCKKLNDKEKNAIVQFGGNASIGYGLCKISVVDANE